MNGFTDAVFRLDKNEFNGMALDIFHFQYSHNDLYRSYTDALRISPAKVKDLRQIPFLPIGFFKTHTIRTTDFEPETVFESSGTTQTINSRHHVKDGSLYRKSFMTGFERFYGPVNNYCIIGLLPAYLERSNSSLVLMVDELVKKSGHPQSGFYLNEYKKLHDVLLQLEKQGQKTILIGVTFALLDFFEEYPVKLEHTIVMETGGMKGRRKEMTRPELHRFLEEQSGLPSIHSEYGMTELLSQAYSKGDGLFECPPWMKIMLRKEDDPFDVNEQGAGIINIIDLANIYSCSFIATDDVGKIFENALFEISGRVDASDVRGCSLLVI
jgi:hypothetical protein